MLSVAIRPFMPSAIMLNVVIISVTAQVNRTETLEI